MALVAGVLYGFEEVSVAPWAADVLGRASSLGVKQYGIGGTRSAIDDAQELDRVLPAVAEVVEVVERLCAGILDDIAKRCLARAEEAVGPARICDTSGHISGADLP